MIVIYIIINLVNGKVYIGSTKDITIRFNRHKYQLNKGIHGNEHLQNAWNKYGEDSFEFKTLMVCSDSERNHCEQMFMDLYNSQNRDYGYNIKDADGHFITEETRLKISESLKGKKKEPFTDSHKQKLSESRKGIEPWNKGKTGCFSDEAIQKMSVAHIGIEPWNKGETDCYSQKTLQKMSESRKCEKNWQYKNYARIIKDGFNKNRQNYALKFKSKIIKRSINVFKLVDWFLKEYPDEDLEISMEVLDNALLS
jgi:group I intron endonuclease